MLDLSMHGQMGENDLWNESVPTMIAENRCEITRSELSKRNYFYHLSDMFFVSFEIYDNLVRCDTHNLSSFGASNEPCTD